MKRSPAPFGMALPICAPNSERSGRMAATRWLQTRARIAYDSEGHPLRIVDVSLDVTGRRILEEQFRQAQKMEAIGLLASGIAHDFNNVLTVICGYSEFLRDGLPAGEQRSDAEEIIQAASPRRGTDQTAARVQPKAGLAADASRPQRTRRERQHHAQAAHRRSCRADHRVRPGAVGCPRRRGTARAGADQPVGECARRHDRRVDELRSPPPWPRSTRTPRSVETS